MENGTMYNGTMENGNCHGMTYGRHEDQFFNIGVHVYARPDVQQKMLKDRVRTLTYRDAMYNNSHLFKDKTVLDVGCGTGILAMFAAKAGAKQVFGIEASNLAEQTVAVVKKNGLDNVVTILKAKVEDVELPGVDKVDIIVSEAMGHCLLHEGMLQSLVVARDRFLKPGGLMFPDKTYLYISAIEDKAMRDHHVGFWDNVYGFDMSPVGESALAYSWIQPVEPKQVVTSSPLLQEQDWRTCSLDDIFFSTPFRMTCEKDGVIHSLAAYFDAEFSACQKKTILSTAPDAPLTHWQQHVFHLKQPLQVQKGEEITGTFTAKPLNGRDLEMDIAIKFNGELGTMNTSTKYLYYWSDFENNS